MNDTITDHDDSCVNIQFGDRMLKFEKHVKKKSKEPFYKKFQKNDHNKEVKKWQKK